MLKALKLLSLFIFMSMLMSGSCDDSDSSSSLSIPIDGIQIDIPQFVIGTEASSVNKVASESDYFNFSSEPVEIKITDEMFSSVSSYIKSLKYVTVKSATITATGKDAEGNNVEGYVKDLSITSVGLSDSFEISYYSLGNAYSTKELNTYVQTAFDNLIQGQTIDFAVSGSTNVPAGTIMNYKIIINSVFEVNL